MVRRRLLSQKIFCCVFMDSSKLSLLSFCIPCGAKCCKPTSANASPILSREEVEKIENFCVKEFGKKSGAFKEVFFGKGSYFVFGEIKNNRCTFLNSKNQCTIHTVKPLACLAYPFKAIYSQNGDVEFILDDSCPASSTISEEFTKRAKKLALKSLSLFSKEVYNNWFGNYLISK